MPHPGLPPTPGSSTALKAKDGVNQIALFHLAFELPPPAMYEAARTSPDDGSKLFPGPATTGVHHAQHISPPSYPMLAAETVKARGRSSAATKESKEGGDGSSSTFALPPPPTRSRKIIQMRPRKEEATDASAAKETGKGPGKSAAKRTATNANALRSGAGSATAAKGGKKPPSATSAAGRKITRKTAHSMIERRRRSKINEELAVLKNMIPACTGEMHKLAILQASIEYIRYLEDCVSQLKAQHGGEQRGDVSGRGRSLPSIREFHPTFHDELCGNVDMSESEAVSPSFTARPDHEHYQTQQQQPFLSPALHVEEARGRQHSYSSSAWAAEYRHHSFALSATPSPAFGPQRHGPYGWSSTSASTVTSPALNPQTELGQEAIAALLMLNNDRRSTASNARGLSVRDLLSG